MPSVCIPRRGCRPSQSRRLPPDQRLPPSALDSSEAPAFKRGNRGFLVNRDLPSPVLFPSPPQERERGPPRKQRPLVTCPLCFPAPGCRLASHTAFRNLKTFPAPWPGIDLFLRGTLSLGQASGGLAKCGGPSFLQRLANLFPPPSWGWERPQVLRPLQAQREAERGKNKI